MSFLVAISAASGASDPATQVLPIFLQYGVVGAVAIVLAYVAYRLYTTSQKRNEEEIKRERDRADRAEQRAIDLEREYREKVIPSLVESTRALADAIDVIRQVRERR